MLAKENRLRTANDFRAARKKARRIEIPGAMITVRYTTETSLYGVVVPNKVARTSVERGSIKRKVRHIFRDHVTDNPTGFVIVVQVLDVKKFNPSEIKNKIS